MSETNMSAHNRCLISMNESDTKPRSFHILGGVSGIDPPLHRFASIRRGFGYDCVDTKWKG